MTPPRVRPSVATWRPATDEYEYQPLRIDARVSRSAAATMLAIRAEFSGWELAGSCGSRTEVAGCGCAAAGPRAAARRHPLTPGG